ncbi:hypothetical protein [Marixanthomonas spongiae]|uniref:hypothetical protein n=1 Tax=Marixanthomonas spongiae TaxID=2174845 RepID=UPI00140217D2|nr:hypothetical protein [Marixanthomonas spongiae]
MNYLWGIYGVSVRLLRERSCPKTKFLDKPMIVKFEKEAIKEKRFQQLAETSF